MFAKVAALWFDVIMCSFPMNLWVLLHVLVDLGKRLVNGATSDMDVTSIYRLLRFTAFCKLPYL